MTTSAAWCVVCHRPTTTGPTCRHCREADSVQTELIHWLRYTCRDLLPHPQRGVLKVVRIHPSQDTAFLVRPPFALRQRAEGRFMWAVVVLSSSGDVRLFASATTRVVAEQVLEGEMRARGWRSESRCTAGHVTRSSVPELETCPVCGGGLTVLRLIQPLEPNPEPAPASAPKRKRARRTTTNTTPLTPLGRLQQRLVSRGGEP